MKKILTAISLFLFLISSSHGQGDSLWYVKDGKGWNGVVAPPSFNSNLVGDEFVIEGISIPQGNNSGDDIFAIFDNGAFYSSRNRSSRFKYLPKNSNPSSISFDFQADNDPNVSFLYFSNLYDQDDPPESISVETGSNISVNQRTNSSIHNTQFNDGMEATHSVITGHDITLIIARDSISSSSFSIPLNTLILNKDKRNKVANLGRCFELSNVFGNNNQRAFYSDTITSVFSGDTLKVDLNGFSGDYIFVNLRPTSVIDDYLPSTGNDDTTYQAYFEVIDTETVAWVMEEILHFNDPNQIQATHRCTTDGKICYKGHFFNDGDLDAGRLALRLKLPKKLKRSTLKFSSLRVNCKDHICKSKQYEIIETDNDSITILFHEDIQIKGYNYQNCKGLVEYSFCVDLSDKGAIYSEDLDLKIGGFTIFNYKDNTEFYYPLNYLDKDNFDEIEDGERQSVLLTSNCEFANPDCPETPPCDWLCELKEKLKNWGWWTIIIIPLVIIGIPRWLKNRKRAK